MQSVEMFTPDIAKKFIILREWLKDQEMNCRKVGREADEDKDASYGDVDAFDMGRIAEAMSIAEDALFNVLNVTSTYGGDKVAEEYLHKHLEDRKKKNAENAKVKS